MILFYIKDSNLCIKEFRYTNKTIKERKILENVLGNDYCIKIDTKDKFYGIASCKGGKVVYMYEDENFNLITKNLFDYDDEKYLVKNLYIKKYEKNIHIMYYVQDTNNRKIWHIASHYYDGNN
ncbi:hypothetical protein SAMN05661008_00248 [Alkalithermobacter thermoalcaliphilus JW-YL-7 = DSM 7308]|uniref:Uncharacterized protein n=1 Tax=Alkalithermobacter thermoalcaliphilus JW-YL-7 = DSM 7308 TaxID=1121328 RepID=A0A150FRH9_CLOPD|nr:hypothetical protein JWYL7_1274 [[Clostridium] paradoxum JW-YL-7 = DSM 7308]SHK42903.1 hypothetical protein SAMN05661008_00248 [[Clostridium] paradoxum JW-YL-7 = DSM 7308]